MGASTLMASWDYRTLDNRAVSAHATPGDAAAASVPANMPQLLSQDTPGAYAYESAQQGQRLAANHLQALTVPGKVVELAGSVRHLSPGSTFTLTEHDGQTEAPHTVLRSIHHARSNLSADLKAQAKALTTAAELHGKLASSPLDTCVSSYGIDSNQGTPSQKKHAASAEKAGDLFYRNAALALPLAVPYRASSTDAHGHLIHPKPSVQGSQTALVIGVPGKPLTTERDHRIKVQFAWQRGSNSHSRMNHPAGDDASAGHSGAPAADDTGSTTGTWVRVATPLAPQAGSNWGSVALPRVGQEVLITFLGGDIDRPVVVGALYNGRGMENAQSNTVVSGGANATGNAPMWFAGDQEGHAHSAVLSGIKTQSLSTSQSGTGAYNQLVFDDTPAQARLGLHTHTEAAGKHSGASELNLGALRQQTDNQLLSPTGYGLELKTHHSGALRAGSGLLLSADARCGNASGAASQQMDAREMVAQLQGAHNLITALGDTAQAHKA